jgi:hypothetical protein
MKKYVILGIAVVSVLVASRGVFANVQGVNQDDQVKRNILAVVRSRFFQTVNSKNYDVDFDFNNDGKILANDYSLLKAMPNGVSESDYAVIDAKILHAVKSRFFAKAGDEQYIKAFDPTNDGKILANDYSFIKRIYEKIQITSTTSDEPVVSGVPQELSADQVRLNLQNIVKSKFFQTTNTEKYDSDFDLNNDGKILANDYSLIKAMPNDVSESDYAVIYPKILNAVKSRFFTKTDDPKFIAELDVIKDGKILANDYSLIKKVLTRSKTEPTKETVFSDLNQLVTSRLGADQANDPFEIYDPDYDFNNDRKIDDLDMAILDRASTGTTPSSESTNVFEKIQSDMIARKNAVEGDPLFNHMLDFNLDKKINDEDITSLHSAFSEVLVSTPSFSIQTLLLQVAPAAVYSSAPAPTSSPTPSPSASPSPTPTASPTPSPTPSASPTPSPSPSPRATVTPTPTPTPSPSASPSASPSPSEE